MQSVMIYRMYVVTSGRAEVMIYDVMTGGIFFTHMVTKNLVNSIIGGGYNSNWCVLLAFTQKVPR